MSTKNLFLAIDKDGNLLFEEKRIDNPEQINKLLSNLKIDEYNKVITSLNNNTYIVEAFDEPLIVNSLLASKSFIWEASAQFNHKITFDLNELRLDEWDRYHGLSTTGAPFVLSNKAQNELFNQLESFDDDTITYLNKVIQNKDWLVKDPFKDVDLGDFWSAKYKEEQKPHWELEAPSPALVDTLTQLKLTKCRIAVLGAGTGNDAAYMAKLGHHITAFDFSDEAIKLAKQKYGHISNLSFVKEDVFNLAQKYSNSFDIVVEHTCYCAVAPRRRNELTKIYYDILDQKGHLLGVMFTLNKFDGPPFGGSEWEIKKRLSKYFTFRYWTRWKNSPANRTGFELVVYAEKK